MELTSDHLILMPIPRIYQFSYLMNGRMMSILELLKLLCILLDQKFSPISGKSDPYIIIQIHKDML